MNTQTKKSAAAKTAAAKTAAATGDGTDNVRVSDVQMGANGGMTVDPAQSDATLAKEVQDVKDSGQFDVEARAGDDLGKALSDLGAGVLTLRQANAEAAAVGTATGGSAVSTGGTTAGGTGAGTGGTTAGGTGGTTAGGTGGTTAGGTGGTGAAGFKAILARRQQGAMQALSGLGSLLSIVIVELGATRVAPVSTGGFPGFKDLRQGAESAANAAEGFPIETNNAHADPQVLRWGGGTVDYLLRVASALNLAGQRIGMTTLPLGQELSTSIGAVCAAATPELPRNLELQTALAPALAYNGANAAKGQQTKAKTKAAKKKGAKQTQGSTAAAGGTQGGTAAAGTAAAGGAPGSSTKLG